MAMNINLRSGTVWNPAVWQRVNTAENHTVCIFRMKKKMEGSPWHHISPQHNLNICIMQNNNKVLTKTASRRLNWGSSGGPHINWAVRRVYEVTV